jgi:hypothetical protein
LPRTSKSRCVKLQLRPGAAWYDGIFECNCVEWWKWFGVANLFAWHSWKEVRAAGAVGYCPRAYTSARQDDSLGDVAWCAKRRRDINYLPTIWCALVTVAVL